MAIDSWTKDKPDKDGLYWYATSDYVSMARVAVDCDSKLTWVHIIGTGRSRLVGDFDVWWMGPVSLPKLPEDKETVATSWVDLRMGG